MPVKLNILTTYIKTIGLLILLCLTSCEKPTPDNPLGNRRPETHLFLMPGPAGIDTTLSTQVLHWWGDDPDGRVVGYFYTWDFIQELYPDSFVWTTFEYDTFLVPIRTRYDEFTFYVKAVDNSAQFNYQGVKISATDHEIFIDSGSEPGTYDENDKHLFAGWVEGIQTAIGAELRELEEEEYTFLPPTDTTGAVDASPAWLTFPIRNSKPKVRFAYNSNPPDTIYAETFTTRTFYWTATDSDGVDTINKFYYHLADEGEEPPTSFDLWTGELPAEQKYVTLRNITEGNHVFYLVVEDIAGDISPIIQYPRPKGIWHVQAPRGDVLLVDDYEPENDIGTWTTDFYHTVLDSVLGGPHNYSIWTIERRAPYSQIDIYETLNFFEAIIWYADGDPHFLQTGPSINRFIQRGNRLLLSSVTSSFRSEGIDSLYTFLKNDSLTIVTGFNAVNISRVPRDMQVHSQVSGYPDLFFADFTSYVDDLVPSPEAAALYRLPPKAGSRGWEGEPVVGVKYPAEGPAQFIFLSFPLHKVYDNSNLNRPENKNAVEFLAKFFAGDDIM